MKVIIGRVYRHFKGNYYIVENIAKDVESGEDVVVYRGLYENGPLWVRKLTDFAGKVDKKKYPNTKQEYRFELIGLKSVVEKQ